MKQTRSMLLIIIVLLQPFGKLWVFLSFQVNQPYIAQKLCVQRNIKGNRCRGNCQLMKQIRQIEEQNQKDKEKYKVVFEELYYQPQHRSVISFAQFIAIIKIKLSFFYQTSYLFKFAETIFQPPELIGR